jgi:Tol biopolymer transport system component/exopolysaccharide biosynthesis protein
MRRIVSMMIVAAMAAGLLAEAVPASSVPPGTNGAIAFTKPDGPAGNFEIFTVPNVGGTADKVTGQPDSIDVDPSWQPPSGNKIAFARKGANSETYDIYTDTVAGTADAARITDGPQNDRQPAWSPTGQIAFTRANRAEDTSQIFKVDDGGGTPAQLTDTGPGAYDASPAWSPTGGELVFVSDRAGGIPTLWKMDSGGVFESQLTFGPCWDQNPSWSPTGDVIVFERFCPGGTSDIYTVSAFGGSATRLTNTGEHDHQPAWSPMGDKIVFTRYPAGGGDKDLMTMSSGGASQTPLLGADGPEAELSGDWGSNTIVRVAASSPAGEEIEATPTSLSRQGVAPQAKKPRRRGKKKSIKRKVIKGVKFLQLRRAKSDVYVLKVAPRLQPTIDVALSNNALPGHEKTSAMAKRHNAVAAINGDFGLPSGRPSHTFAEDGDLKQISFATAPSFAIRHDEQGTYFERPFETVTAIEGTDTWQVDRWNFGEPTANDISVFTAAGTTLEIPPGNTCSARLAPTGARRWAPNLAGVEADFLVNQVACAAEPMPLNGAIVLSAQPGSDGAILLNSLQVGETLELTWSVDFAGVLDTIGGTPKLVSGGVNAVTSCSGSICNKHPRTGIGVTAQGKILMVVIDGRRENSKGVTMKKFASIMRGLKAVEAINLDGGGSSTMVVKGKVGNVPSDGKQRKVSSAVLVLKGPDPGDVIGAPQAKLPSQPPAKDGSGVAALLDPASTGGLLESMAEGTFGPPVDLPPNLERALRRFLRSQ